MIAHPSAPDPQPIGAPLPHWRPPSRPGHAPMHGSHAALEPLTSAHADALWRAFSRDVRGSIWTYLPDGPFAGPDAFAALVDARTASVDPMFFAVMRDARACGMAAFLRIDAANGCIEIGHLAFAPELQRTPAATEALHLMLAHAFALGYRRVEWKCNALNAPSRRAATRLGFTYEGTFRQAAVVKGHNRDTAWYSMLDHEWPTIQAAHLRWLDPANFGTDGGQVLALSALTARVPEALP